MLHQSNIQAIACVVGSKILITLNTKKKKASKFSRKINLLVLAAHEISCAVSNRKQSVFVLYLKISRKLQIDKFFFKLTERYREKFRDRRGISQ